MTREEFKARVSMSYGDPMTWDQHLEAVWQLHLKASNHWISVEDELPKEKGRLFLVCLKDGRVGESAYDVEDDIWYRQSGTVLNPTHWMPMPPAPRKED